MRFGSFLPWSAAFSLHLQVDTFSAASGKLHLQVDTHHNRHAKAPPAGGVKAEFFRDSRPISARIVRIMDLQICESLDSEIYRCTFLPNQ